MEQNSWSNPADLCVGRSESCTLCCLLSTEFCLQLLPQRHIARVLSHSGVVIMPHIDCAGKMLSAEKWISKGCLWDCIPDQTSWSSDRLLEWIELQLCTNVMPLLATSLIKFRVYCLFKDFIPSFCHWACFDTGFGFSFLCCFSAAQSWSFVLLMMVDDWPGLCCDTCAQIFPLL